MPPIPKLYRAVNEVTGEMMIDIATVLAEKLCTTQTNINGSASKNKMIHREWRVRKVHETEDDEIWFMSDTQKQEWEAVCAPFRELSRRKRERTLGNDTGDN